MPTDRQTDMTKLTVTFRNLTQIIGSHFCPFFPKTESFDYTSSKFRRNSTVRIRSKPGGQQTKE
jgi:hypothetical protein